MRLGGRVDELPAHLDLNMPKVSPIYARLYENIYLTNEMQNYITHVCDILSKVCVVSYTYSEGFNGSILFSVQVQSDNILTTLTTSFKDGKIIPLYVSVDKFMDTNDLVKIMKSVIDNNIVYVHGLCSIETMMYGSNKGQKNRFIPWVLNKIRIDPGVISAQHEAQNRIFTQLTEMIQDDNLFKKFFNDVMFNHLSKAIAPFTHLPLEQMHRIIDMIYVKTVLNE